MEKAAADALRAIPTTQQGGKTMNLKDLFVPRYLHSDPEVRLKLAKNSNDTKLLRSMAEKDADENVRKAAAERADALMAGQHQAA